MTNKTQVAEQEAGALQALLAQVMEVGLRQQSLSGQIDNALVRNVIAYLNNNGITVCQWLIIGWKALPTNWELSI